MTFTPLLPEDPSAFAICFVCTGNICRSPMAEVVLRALAETAGLSSVVNVSSAGTGDWHVGEPADSRTLDALEKAGYDGTGHRARQFDSLSFESLDLVVVLDRGQERILGSWATNERDRSKVHRLLGFEPTHHPTGDVPDPYYSDAEMFDAVLGMIEKACVALFAQIEPALRNASSMKTATAVTSTIPVERKRPQAPPHARTPEPGDSIR